MRFKFIPGGFLTTNTWALAELHLQRLSRLISGPVHPQLFNYAFLQAS